MDNNAKTNIGRMIRILREVAGLTQERLAERADISYQYLSAIENGKENFSIGVLESLSDALSISLPDLIERAFSENIPTPDLKKEYFIPAVSLPHRLTIPDIEAALNETHRIIRLINTTLRHVSGRPLSAYIQGNNFSGIVSNILCDAFSRLTPYKHNHDQRYPDLICRDTQGMAEVGLEVKATIRPGKGGESHNGHSGWHVVACFSLDRTYGDICFIHVMFADLVGHGEENADWEYLGSKVNEMTGSRRTETYITTPEGTTKLRHGTVYLNTELVDITRWRTSPKIKPPTYSPFVHKKGK